MVITSDYDRLTYNGFTFIFDDATEYVRIYAPGYKLSSIDLSYRTATGLYNRFRQILDDLNSRKNHFPDRSPQPLNQRQSNPNRYLSSFH